jgi:hypothetical protein
MSKANEDVDITIALAAVAALIATLPARKRFRWVRRMRRSMGDAVIVSRINAADIEALWTRYERLLPTFLALGD